MNQPIKSVLLVTHSLKIGGHSHDYIKSWIQFLKAKEVPAHVKSFGGVQLGSFSLPLQLLTVVLDTLSSLFFWTKLVCWMIPRGSVILFTDAPCTFPRGFRIISGIALKIFRNRTFIICHAFPAGGDTLPDDQNPMRWKSLFEVKGVFAHSSVLRSYLSEKVKVSPEIIFESSWGCEPLKPCRAPVQDGKLKVLFLGQYRSSKGLEWLWSELKDFQLQIQLIIVVSGVPAVLEKVKSWGKGAQSQHHQHTLSIHTSTCFSNQEITSFFEMADVLIIPYTYEHQLVSGLVYLAASHGVPVISSTHSESGMIPHQHGFGDCFTPLDGDLLRSALERFHRLNRDEIIRLRQKALEFGASHPWNDEFQKIFSKMIEVSQKS